MILVDSSCWVEFYRPSGERGVQDAVAEAIETEQVATCGLVKVEILPFVRSPGDYEALLEDFAAYAWLDTREAEYDLAVRLGRALRERGVTVPATDLVIAATAIGHDALLLHADRHFELIAELGDLRQRNAGVKTGRP